MKLGLLPGAQGTVRLPRVTGMAVAMNMIASGEPISAPDALKYGIIDKVKSFIVCGFGAESSLPKGKE